MITTPERVLLFGALEGSCSLRAWNALVESAEDALDLVEIDLSGYDISGLSFSGCDLRGAKFTECRANGVSFEQANLEGADFSRAELGETNFTRARGASTRFVGATLDGTDFSWAKLQNSDFSECRVDKATFWKTDLRGAKIELEGLSAEQDCLTDTELTPVESLRELLARIAGLTGRRFRLDPEIPNRAIQVPPNLQADPNGVLKSLCRALELKIERTSEPDIYVVKPR